MPFNMEVSTEKADKSEDQEPFMKVPDEAAIKIEVLEQVKPAPKEVAELQAQAETNVAVIIGLDNDESAEKKDILQKIEFFGGKTMKRSAAKNSLLQARVGELSKNSDEGSVVAKGLVDLQRELRCLDPSPIDVTGIGIIDWLSDRVRAYFAKYQKAESMIEGIIISLDKGKTTLEYDNKTLQIERDTMRELTKQLNKEIQLGILMKEMIKKEIEAARARNEDLEKVIFFTEEVLTPLQQRLMDMGTMIAVNQQAVITTEIVIRNNKELMRGVERAIYVTVPAFRNSVMIAGALSHQEEVQKKMDALKVTTEEIIRINGERLKQIVATTHEMALEPYISIETLNKSFADASEALESISAYKQKVLPIMEKNIDLLKDLTAKGEEQIQQLEKGHKLGL